MPADKQDQTKWGAHTYKCAIAHIKHVDVGERQTNVWVENLKANPVAKWCMHVLKQ